MNIYSKLILNNEKMNQRPKWPKRMVITGGMPNGNKQLHIGHLAAVFIWADVFARFMRSNIGKDNVIFLSGTDGFGSPIEERYRISKENGEFNGTIEEYVNSHHLDQKRTLKKYDISLNVFAASCLDPYTKYHEEMGNNIFNKLHDFGYVTLNESLQFFDTSLNKFLNGRQVVGKCPIEGCVSEYGYADECSLGHQYQPSELINPISVITNTKPELKKAKNWYFPLDKFKFYLQEWVDYCARQNSSRPFMLTIIKDFLKNPVLYVNEKYIDKVYDIKNKLPECKFISPNRGNIYQIEFNSVIDRDFARQLFMENGIRCRTSNALFPFRLTGDVEWGLKVPASAKVADGNIKSFWVWPESLWAPISFTDYYLHSINSNTSWTDWWCSDDSEVWQFIGEDNIYFYAVVEPALFEAFNRAQTNEDAKIRKPKIISNKHVLFKNVKASSSSKFKAPTAEELLNNYNVDQLKMHFLAQGLETNQFQFRSKIYTDPDLPGKDPVIAQGDLLYNIFNRMARSILYTVQKNFEGVMPVGEVSEKTLKDSLDVILAYEQFMYSAEMHKIISLIDVYLRNANKEWAKVMNFSNGEPTKEEQKQAIIDALHIVRTAMTLIHPIAQSGTEMMSSYFGFTDEIWEWKSIFKSAYELIPIENEYKFKFLEPRVDFFKKEF